MNHPMAIRRTSDLLTTKGDIDSYTPIMNMVIPKALTGSFDARGIIFQERFQNSGFEIRFGVSARTDVGDDIAARRQSREVGPGGTKKIQATAKHATTSGARTKSIAVGKYFVPFWTMILIAAMMAKLITKRRAAAYTTIAVTTATKISTWERRFFFSSNK